MNMEEQQSAAYRRFLAHSSRDKMQPRKSHRLLWGIALLLFVALVVGGSLFFFLPFPLQPDAHTLYSTDWSSDFHAWQGAGWRKRMKGGVHSDHGGVFLSPYTTDGSDIQIDAQMKLVGVEDVNGGISFGIMLRRNGQADYKIAIGGVDPSSYSDGYQPPYWSPDSYQPLNDFAIVSVKLQGHTLTLLINGKQVAQKIIDFTFQGTLGLFAGGDSIIEARSFRVDKLVS